ncbi:MAG: mechanosensitive ion channel [Burkholderiaceae bacterium]|nr:mechanosensitive ion channel [Burkholderiaceae bacterium]
MREQLLELRALLAPYVDELKLLGSIVAILLLALALRFALNRILRRFFAGVGARAPTVDEQRRIGTIGNVLRNTVSLLIIAIAVMLILNQIGISIAPILGAAGVVGIAVGFGAQSLVKDVFSGFFLLIENQIRVGDVVEIVGKSGVVEELTLRRTKLRSYDGSVHYISNGLVTTVTNMSAEFAFAVVDVAVTPGENVDHVFEVMRATAQELRAIDDFGPKILGDLEIAGVDRWTDTALTIRARIKTRALDQWSVRREYLQRLETAFRRANIRFPSPPQPAAAPPGPSPGDPAAHDTMARSS